MLPVKIYQPDKFIPSEENMDLLTTYKQDYNPYPVCRMGSIKPRDSKYPCGDKMECLPTYKGGGECLRGSLGKDRLSLCAGQEMGFTGTPSEHRGWANCILWAKSGLQACFFRAGELRMVFKFSND